MYLYAKSQVWEERKRYRAQRVGALLTPLAHTGYAACMQK